MKTLIFLPVFLGSWLTVGTGLAAVTAADVKGPVDNTESVTLPGDSRGHIYAEIETSKGVIEAELDFVYAPLPTMNFIGLAEGTLPFQNRPKATPFYDGTTFHRVVEDFVIQGGDPQSADPAFPVDKLGEGGPGYSFPDQFSPRLRHDMAGVLSMANDGPDTNGSQFFITLREVNRLNYLHSVFGQVVRGMDVVNKIEQGDKILHVTIRRTEGKPVASITVPVNAANSDKAVSPKVDAQAFRANEASFKTLEKSVLENRRPGSPEGFVPLVDETKQLPDFRLKNFNDKLANYQRTTSHRIVVRLLPEFMPAMPEQSVGNAAKNIADTLKLPDAGDNVLACYFKSGDTWNIRLGEATYPALLGQSGTTEQLMASGAMHQGKFALLKSAQELTKAGKLKEGVDAVIDTLILRMDDYTLKQSGTAP